MVTTESNFSCTSCTFETNTASRGGALYVESDSRTELDGCTFDGNKANKDGSACYMATSKPAETSRIQNTDFTYNEVENSGTIYLIQSSLSLDEVTFKNNTTSGKTAGVSLIVSDLNLTNSVFEDQTADLGGFIYSAEDSNVNITSSTFDNITADTSGGFLYASSSNVTLSDVTVNKANSTLGSAIYCVEES